jgi:hypothetical protein
MSNMSIGNNKYLLCKCKEISLKIPSEPWMKCRAKIESINSLDASEWES